MQNSRLSIKAALRWLCRIPPGNPELQSRLPSPRADQRGGLIWLAEPTGHRSGLHGNSSVRGWRYFVTNMMG